jgi:predicted outer membrane protein
MLRRTLLLATAATAAPAGLAVGKAVAQANITPDPTPRLPPQPGQGLPLEDARFLRNAAALSAAQAGAAALAAERASDEGTRRFAAGLAERHRRLVEQVRGLASARGVSADAPRPGEEEPGGGPMAGARQRLEALRTATGPSSGGDLNREFLAAQIEVHPALIELYQTEASHTTDRELGRFAITSLVGLQEDFAAAARLGERHGLRRPDGVLANPPQYGPGAGPPR